MDLYIDRSLPITLVEQIKGQIAYQIAYGRLSRGTALPSVRELATQLNVAPMTITRVYRELGEQQLLITKPGVGTFVADITRVEPRSGSLGGERGLHQVANGYIQQALAQGHSPEQIRDAFLDSWQHHCTGTAGSRVALVGNFRQATEAYAHDVERILKDLNVKVEVVLRDELRTELPSVLERLKGIELVIAVPTRLQEIRTLLEPRGFYVVAVAFQVSTDTRLRIASIPPTARVGVVATYPEFLTSLLEGIAAYGLPAAQPRYALRDREECVKEVLAESDVVVYASGSAGILEWLPEGVEAFEYRHVPDPVSLNRLRHLIVARRVEDREQAPVGAEIGLSG